MNFNKKNLGMLGVAVLIFIVIEGTGVSAAPKQWISMATTKVKGFFSGLFSK